MEQCIGIISDTHAGSIFGLHPPDFIDSSDTEIGANPGQLWLWDCYQDYCEKAKTNRPVAMIVNGDVIDGAQRKSQGSELNLSRLGDQGLAAENILNNLRANVGSDIPFFFTRGTAYHVGEAGKEEESVARALGARKRSGVGSGSYVGEVLDLEIGGVNFNFAHHIGGSIVYKAAPIEKEIAASLHSQLRGYPKIDMLVRSHLHHFIHVETGSRHGLITPCWQLQTSYARKKSVFTLTPDIGGLFVWFDPERKLKGQDPIVHVQKLLYPLPPVQVTVL